MHKVTADASGGSLKIEDGRTVFEEAQRRGVKRLIFTHPEDIVGASLNAVFGLIVAWVLVRYRFPGRRVLDAIVADLAA